MLIFICFRDELGNVLAWRRLKEEFETEEYEMIGKIHLKDCSITKVSTVLTKDNCIKVFTQSKAGFIKTFSFVNAEFKENATDAIPCGTFTFCRMSTLKLGNEVVISYPSPEMENAVNVLIESEGIRRYLIRNFMSNSSGMCLFTKLYAVQGEVFLLCGYEIGKIILAKLTFNNEPEILFEERIFDESCTDADLIDGTIVAVSAGKLVKIIKDFSAVNCTVELPFAGCNSVAIRSDGRIFVTGGWDGKIRYFSLKSGKLLAIIDHHFDAISDLKFRPDFGLLAASSDGTITLFSLYT